MKKNHERINPLPPGFGDSFTGSGAFDPFGSYTGLVSDSNETPVQDADDL